MDCGHVKIAMHNAVSLVRRHSECYVTCSALKKLNGLQELVNRRENPELVERCSEYRNNEGHVQVPRGARLSSEGKF